MEKIINYKLKDFLKLKDEHIVNDYLFILDLLKPSKLIDNPNYRWWKKAPKKLPVISVKQLSFEGVTNIRTDYNESSIESIFECVSKVTGLCKNDLYKIRILDFYGVLSSIKNDLNEISNMEINQLSSDDFDINLESVRANERMAKFGVLNPINSLANDDITKWQEIEKLPYLVVFTKLLMDKEKAAIQKELDELQKRKMNKN